MNIIAVLKTIMAIGTVFALIISVSGYILLTREVKNPDNAEKTVEETNIEKYSNIYSIGLILSILFSAVSLILRIVSYNG